MSAILNQTAASESEIPKGYPGNDATVGQLIMLADQYCTAAHALLPQSCANDVKSSAPARLCAIHAIEVYLNAFLAFHEMSAEQIRGLQHNLAERARLSVAKGLCFRAKTAEHLVRLNDQREYLLVRYGADGMKGLSELTRVFATLREVSEKVRSVVFNQRYEQSDSRFKKYW